MKILYFCAVFIGFFFALVWIIDKVADNDYTPERGYIGAGIRKVEIDNKYVCFVLYERHAISCVQKEVE